ncbi:hypothetical protein FXO37_16422 [Capsicum annuum]|nr:hypothetical protein FXO37_16422 [Capsicum annuum]
MLKELSVNIPLVEALEKMPGYAKFMKDLVIRKRTVSYNPANNVHHQTSIASRSLVEKKKGPVPFTIPCTIGSFNLAWDLCDLGASFNLIPLVVFKRLDDMRVLFVIDINNDKVNTVIVPIEKRLGIETLVEGIMNFDSDGIKEYDEMVELCMGERKRFIHEIRKFFWDEPYLFNIGMDGMIHRFIPEIEIMRILEACHASPVEGHYGETRTAHKILQCGYYYPTIYKDAHDFSLAYDQCQCQGNISRYHEPPMILILELELFDVEGVNFIDPFISFFKKLKSRWYGSFTVVRLLPHSAIELKHNGEALFKVNGQTVKHYMGTTKREVIAEGEINYRVGHTPRSTLRIMKSITSLPHSPSYSEENGDDDNNDEKEDSEDMSEGASNSEEENNENGDDDENEPDDKKRGGKVGEAIIQRDFEAGGHGDDTVGFTNLDDTPNENGQSKPQTSDTTESVQSKRDRQTKVREIVIGDGSSRPAYIIYLSINTTLIPELTLNAPVTTGGTAELNTPITTGATDDENGVCTEAPRADTT